VFPKKTGSGTISKEEFMEAFNNHLGNFTLAHSCRRSTITSVLNIVAPKWAPNSIILEEVD
jgi:hypothetical protein